MGQLASWDMLVFVHVVMKKCRDVGGQLIRNSGTGSVIGIPPERLDQMKKLRALHSQFEQGNFVISTNIIANTIDLATWIAATHAELKGHSFRQPDIDYRDLIAKPDSAPPAQPASYRRAEEMADKALAS